MIDAKWNVDRIRVRIQLWMQILVHGKCKTAGINVYWFFGRIANNTRVI